MLAAIQHQQHLLARQQRRQRIWYRHPLQLAHTQHRSHRQRHPRWVRDGRQLHHPHPVSEPARHPPGHLTCQPGLTHPARPGHRHQPKLTQQPGDLIHRTGPADETRQRRHQAMHGPRHRILHHSHTISAGRQATLGQPGRRTSDDHGLRTPGRTRAARPRRARHRGHRRPAARRLGSRVKDHSGATSGIASRYPERGPANWHQRIAATCPRRAERLPRRGIDDRSRKAGCRPYRRILARRGRISADHRA